MLLNNIVLRNLIFESLIFFSYKRESAIGNLNSKQGEEIMDLFKQLNKEGVTIIQVTHSEKNAGYGTHIINLLDGRIEN